MCVRLGFGVGRKVHSVCRRALPWESATEPYNSWTVQAFFISLIDVSLKHLLRALEKCWETSSPGSHSVGKWFPACIVPLLPVPWERCSVSPCQGLQVLELSYANSSSAGWVWDLDIDKVPLTVHSCVEGEKRNLKAILPRKPLHK